MTEPVFFVVERGIGGDVPAVYHDILPHRLTRKIPKGSSELPPMIYALRLDLLPEAERYIDASPQDIYKVYCKMRDAGTLPPQNLIPPTIVGEGTTRHRKFGEWWTPPEVPWDRSAEPYRPGDPKPAV